MSRGITSTIENDFVFVENNSLVVIKARLTAMVTELANGNEGCVFESRKEMRDSCRMGKHVERKISRVSGLDYARIGHADFDRKDGALLVL